MDSGHHGVLQGPSFPEKVGPRHDPRSFSGASGVFWGGGLRPPPSVSLYSFFIVVSFLLNGVPGVGDCSISPSLQLLGVVIRTEKYGRVRHMALNAIITASPLDTSVSSVVLFCFSAFPALVLFLLCGSIWNVTTNGRLPLLSSAISMPRRILPMAKEGLFLPMTEERFFLGMGPWPSVDIDVSLLVFTPHNT